MKNNIIKILALFIISLSTHASEIPVSTVNLEADLGTSYHTEKEDFGAESCIATGTVIRSGKAESILNFSTSMSEERAASSLGYSVGLKARFGVVSTNASAKFLNDVASSSLSVSAVWESVYKFPVKKLILTSAKLNEIGESVRNNDERWAETCGDEFVTEITEGARLLFSVRVDFASEQEKKDFSSEFSLSGPFGGVNATMKKASERFGRRTKVTVSAYQVGGDVSKLSEVFGQSSDEMVHFTKCTVGDFDDCAKVIASALIYASNTTTGFPSQLANDSKFGPATLSYRTASYKDLGIYPTNYPFADVVVKQSRKELSDMFEHQFRLKVLAHRLLQQNTLGDRVEIILGEEKKIESNIAAILEVSKVCYEDPKNCFDSVRALKMIAINEKEFKPMSFVDYCNLSKNQAEDGAIRITIDYVWKFISRSGFANGINSCESLARAANRAESLYLNEWSYDNLPIPNNISDLRPLASLYNLKQLRIFGARVKDISPLANLENLEQLGLPDNRVYDISPLEDLKQLTFLNMSNNQIVDISPISGLSKLQNIVLDRNKISNVSSLEYYSGIQFLNLWGNPITKDDYTKLIDRLKPQMFPPYWR